MMQNYSPLTVESKSYPKNTLLLVFEELWHEEQL